jgi:hypothetical protein
VDPISKLARAVALTRRQAAGKRTDGTAKTPAGAAPAGAQRSHQQQLKVDIARRLKAIGSADSRRRNEAVRVLLEHMLLHEFGEPSSDAAQLAATVADVQRVMDADPRVRAALDALLQELVAGLPAGGVSQA